MNKIELLVLDMAGTTVRDEREVERCFFEAADATGLQADPARIVGMMGLPKRVVFETLWQEQLGADSADLVNKIDESYIKFKIVLENHYQTQPVEPTEGCLEAFAWAKAQGIPIALNTGFYREVTDMILQRLGWDQGLDAHYVGSRDRLIQYSVTPSEIHGNEGRPAPFMIQKAMYRLGVTDPQRVVVIGDTPSDLAAGMNAHAWSLGVTNGTHTRSQLEEYPHHGLLDSLHDLESALATLFSQQLFT